MGTLQQGRVYLTEIESLSELERLLAEGRVTGLEGDTSVVAEALMLWAGLNDVLGEDVRVDPERMGILEKLPKLVAQARRIERLRESEDYGLKDSEIKWRDETLQIRFVTTALGYGVHVSRWYDWTPCGVMDGIELRLEPLLNVVGHVRGPRGASVTNAHVHLEQLPFDVSAAEPGEAPVAAGGPGPRDESAWSETSGFFHFTAASNRRVQLVVTAKGFNDWSSTPIQLPRRRGTVTIDAMLEEEDL
ncbi:MAG: hypothetical protein DRQ55_15995 [Planctomycetota bacterium]|nr:MAG: hypothetical protein DRQ55_15995 [Planctomycetota bacterium]